MGPPKKNLTTLRRSNAQANSTNIPEKKSDSVKEDSSSKAEIDLSMKKEKEAKEEKNEKIKSEGSIKEEKGVDGFDQMHFDKTKQGSKKSEIEGTLEASKKDNSLSDDKEKSRDKDKHEHSGKSESNRDRRRDQRERGGNSRSRGSGSFGNQVPVGAGNNNTRYDNSRGRGGSSGSRSTFGHGGTQNSQPSAALSGGVAAYRGKREYRRSKVERGPRFDRQKEREKIKDDKKDKHSDDTSCSEVDDAKLGHLRQKDEDSEVSVDEASASTTESAQAEKYQSNEMPPEEEVRMNDSSSVKDINTKNEKYKKDKKDNLKVDSKSYDGERFKEDKGGFAPRGEPSRRGRGGSTLSFRNSRGGSRYGPSSYGPPPSRAGFGGNKSEKLEEQKIVEENFIDNNQCDFKNSMVNVDNMNSDIARESNKSRSLERPQQRRPGRYEHLPPRFQKRQDSRFQKFDQSGRGRGRGRSGYQGSGGQMISKTGLGGKENLSDVANEEWETASESSDVGERRDKPDDRDDPRKKEQREKGSATRKSFSSQRPVNEGNQGRRSNNESRRGGQNSSERNRQRDAFPRETRSRDSGRGRQNNFAGGGGGERRTVNNNGNTSRPSSSAGHPGGVGRNNGGRGGNPSSKTGAFQPKNEATTAVYRVDEIKLQDPNGVQAALTDLTNR